MPVATATGMRRLKAVHPNPGGPPSRVSPPLPQHLYSGIVLSEFVAQRKGILVDVLRLTTHRLVRFAIATGVTLCVVAGCSVDQPTVENNDLPVTSQASTDSVTPPANETDTDSAQEPLAVFPVGGAVDYQLGGAYDLPAGTDIVVRDSWDTPAPGAFSICYVNGFQTQPGEEERWEGVNSDLLLRDDSGQPVIDPDWPDEFVLDTTSESNRIRIANIISDDLNRCAKSGFDAVEIDNLDTYTRFEALTRDGSVELARLYGEVAHAAGMLIGQKNAAEDTELFEGHGGFDFAVTEECLGWNECAAYTNVYGQAVISIEYSDDDRLTLEDMCADSTRPESFVYRDRNLTTPDSPEYVFERCTD